MALSYKLTVEQLTELKTAGRLQSKDCGRLDALERSSTASRTIGTCKLTSFMQIDVLVSRYTWRNWTWQFCIESGWYTITRTFEYSTLLSAPFISTNMVICSHTFEAKMSCTKWCSSVRFSWLHQQTSHSLMKTVSRNHIIRTKNSDIVLLTCWFDDITNIWFSHRLSLNKLENEVAFPLIEAKIGHYYLLSSRYSP